MINGLMQLFNSSGRDVAADFMMPQGYIRIEHEAGGRSESETRGRIVRTQRADSEGLNRLYPSQSDKPDGIAHNKRRQLQLLAIGGDDEATESFVLLGVAVGIGVMPFMEPFVVLDGITEIGIGFCGSFFDELEGLPLGGSHRVRIPMLGHVRDDLFAETVGEIETMSIRRDLARIGFEFFV